MLPGLTFRAWAHWWSGNQRSDEIKMGMPFEPEEIDDLDESLLEEIDQEELAEASSGTRISASGGNGKAVVMMGGTNH